MARTITSPTTSFTSSFLGGTSASSVNPALTDPNDPFYAFLRPPPGETLEERMERERREAEARKVNDEIDEMLRAEKSAMKKRKKPVKVLLLGQSESGKSTTLKIFQMTYARKAWKEEHSAWRSVIQLNLCRTVNLILDVLTEEMAFDGALSIPSSPGDLVSSTTIPAAGPSSSIVTGKLGTPDIEELPREATAGTSVDKGKGKGKAVERLASPVASPHSYSTPRTPHSPDANPLEPLHFDEKHKLLKLKLGPLKRVQRDLEVRLGAGAEELSPALAGAAMTEAAPFGGVGEGMASGSGSGSAVGAGTGSAVAERGNATSGAAGVSSFFVPPSRRGPQEFYVRSSTGWKAALDRLRPQTLGASTSARTSFERASGKEAARDREAREAKETTEIIAACREDIAALWGDETVRTMLARKRLRLEERGGFFLNDIDRIAVPDYEPDDSDIVRARLRTLGVQEYRFVFEKGLELGQEWLMYDVGGARSLRAAWPPYFDDLNAIIFLAPISCFDEKLAEDRRVNRLEDSLLLWKAVCANKLLKHTQLTLFLNKCDLLEKKLEAGVLFRNYVPSYGEWKKNDVETVTKYLKQKFREMSKQYSPQPRGFYAHLTSVVDTKATAVTLATVREGILREHLRGADLI